MLCRHPGFGALHLASVLPLAACCVGVVKRRAENSLDQGQKGLANPLKRQCGQSRLSVVRLLEPPQQRRRWHQDVVESLRDQVLTSSERLSQEALYTVSYDGVATGFADGDPQTRVAAAILSYENSEDAIGGSPIHIQDGLELAIAQKLSVLWKTQTLQRLSTIREKGPLAEARAAGRVSNS